MSVNNKKIEGFNNSKKELEGKELSGIMLDILSNSIGLRVHCMLNILGNVKKVSGNLNEVNGQIITIDLLDINLISATEQVVVIANEEGEVLYQNPYINHNISFDIEYFEEMSEKMFGKKEYENIDDDVTPCYNQEFVKLYREQRKLLKFENRKNIMELSKRIATLSVAGYTEEEIDKLALSLGVIQEDINDARSIVKLYYSEGYIMVNESKTK